MRNKRTICRARRQAGTALASRKELYALKQELEWRTLYHQKSEADIREASDLIAELKRRNDRLRQRLHQLTPTDLIYTGNEQGR